MAINEKFQAHLMTDPGSGGSIQRTGCGDEAIIGIRKTSDGFISLALTLNNYHYDKIYIGNISSFIINCIFNFGTGPITHTYIYPQFSIDGVNFYPQAYMVYTGGISTVHQHRYYINTSITRYSFIINNPSSNWVRFYTLGIGNTTGSSGIIQMARGWNSGHPMGFK